LCRQGRFKEADMAFQQALLDKSYARTAEVYENAGLCALKATDLSAAKDYLKTALKQDPARPQALVELIGLNFEQGNFSDAKYYLNLYKKIAEPTARTLWLGIQVAEKMNDLDGAASQGLILKDLFADSPEYQLYLKSDLGKI
jgi:type IV pilus assembly protein PilF